MHWELGEVECQPLGISEDQCRETLDSISGFALYVGILDFKEYMLSFTSDLS